MAYYLSEAYQDLYNPRVESYIDENLQYVDYLTDDDIVEVVESIYWELRDYGMSLDEALDALKYSASEDVICESMVYLAEARVTVGRGSEADVRSAEKQRRSAQRADRNLNLQNRAKVIQRGVTNFGNKLYSGLKSAWEGAKGGMGTAAKQAGGYLSKQKDDAKARLTGLLRRGISSARNVAKGVSNKVSHAAAEARRIAGNVRDELSGKAAERSRQQNLQRKLQRNIRRASAKTDTSAFEKPQSGMSPEVNAATERYKERFLKNRERRSAISKQGEQRREASTERQRRLGSARRPSRPPQQKLLPPARETSGTESSRRENALKKIAKAASGASVKGVRFAAPGAILSSQRSNTGKREAAANFARRAGVNEAYEYILENIIVDLIDEGYAYDYNDAINIIESFNQYTLNELIESYLD